MTPCRGKDGGAGGDRPAPVAIPRYRVLLVGATGVFGRRLAEGLVREPGVALILAGRTPGSLAKLKHDLGGGPEVQVFDRNRADPGSIRGLQVGIVIDAAGPFQSGRTGLIEAAVDAGCHYLDLADGRAFVANVRCLDGTARRRNVAALSGASTTPALSHAAIDRMTEGWHHIDAIRVAISPGNRAPRGLAVVRAILSYAGRPVRLFRDGSWITAPGWGLTHEIAYPGIGRRAASLCETPDLDLLVERFRPRVSAEFFAGLELAILHYGLLLASLPVRARLMGSLEPLARPMRFLADLFRPLGSDCGGMVVEVRGTNAGRERVAASWSLVARAGMGPYVPTLAALALVRRLCDGALIFRGAGPCVGHLTLDDFEGDFERLGIETRIQTRRLAPAPACRRSSAGLGGPAAAPASRGPGGHAERGPKKKPAPERATRRRRCQCR
jgi:saccharopine dehydrogenase-like NADP-dependent oxidoreductase